MIVKQEESSSVYFEIKQNAVPIGSTTILIILSNDPDSICATKILQSLLKQDCLAHHTKPASNYTDLAKINEKFIEDNDELKSIILINCGGQVDITDFISFREDLKIYVFDSHRPVNLQNIYGNYNVCMVDDGDLNEMDDIQEAFSVLISADNDDLTSSEEDDEDEDEDEDAENDEDSNEIEVKEDETAEENSTEEENKLKRKKTSEDRERTKKKNKSENTRLEKGQKLLEKQEVIRKYYSEGSFYGTCASVLMYNLVSQIGDGSNDILWWAILGLTEQYLNDKISFEKYEIQLENYNEEVVKFNVTLDTDVNLTSLSNNNSTDSIPNSSTAAPRLDNNSDMEGTEDLLLPSVGLNGVRSANDQTIFSSEEFRVMLLRHWNLLDSMYHSTYVATKLGVWKEKGRQKLLHMLCMMGFPQKECNKPYTSMDLKFKKDLKYQLKKVAPKYNMSEIVFPSFVRRFGYKITTSASDGVYSLSALLDCGGDWIDRYAYGDIPMDIAMNRVNLNSASSRLGVLKGGVKRHDESVDGRGYGQQQGVGVGTKTGLAAIGLRLIEFSEGLSKYQKSSLKSGEESEEVDEDEKWVKNFWVAFDSLENSDLMVYGIHLSMQFQATLVETGVSILERSIVRSFKKFRLGVLNNGTGISITSNNNQENRSLLNFLNEKEGNQNQKNNSGKPQSKRVKTSIDKEFSIFSKSSTHLKKLSKFILEAFQACNYTSLPLILAFLNEENDTFLCCGTMLLSKAGLLKKNKFGIAFQESAELSGAKVKHDSFDVCVIEIKREDLMDFIEKLKLVL